MGKYMENKNKELHSIFQGIANKDENEFNKLYKNYKSLIYAAAFSMLKNKEDSEEVVQTVFEKIWNIKERNLPTSNETAWMYNVTKNETINYLRKQKNTLNIDDIYYIDEENEELNNIINTDYYNKILSKLNAKDKEIVSLKILSDLSFREISQILDIPIGTVQWKYYRSLHTLKILMSNLTLFILTFTLFIKQQVSIKKFADKSEEKIKASDNEEKLESSNDTENKLLNEFENTNRALNSTISKNQETTMKNLIEENKEATQKKEILENKIIKDIEETEETLNETIESTIAPKTENIKPQNSTLFYISSIFCIMTIIFLVIWIKQKRQRTTKT